MKGHAEERRRGGERRKGGERRGGEARRGKRGDVVCKHIKSRLMRAADESR